MDRKEDKKLLIKIAQMYYEQNLTQSEISGELGIYRTTISRMLKRVREEGIVTITINYDIGDHFTLEQELKERFGLQEAIVVEVDSAQSSTIKRKAIGQACARWLEQVLQPKDTIGFSWGSSLAAVVESLTQAQRPFVTCVPTVGGPSGKMESGYHVNNICYQAALKWGARSLMIDVPAITEQKETRDQLMNSQYYQSIAKAWDHLDIAVFGIGSPEMKGEEAWRGFYGDAVIAELENGKVAGDICSRFYDGNGIPVHTGISDRTLTIDLEQIKQARFSIGVAESLEKASGILGALNGGYMNVLVTTQETAQKILE
ncbi:MULTISPECIES: sugar-binding transcriptional regulator [Paenibacillus]|uniref:sugar-binding transcriptional regulator n=1 Tax=Paenibacillus TaxID=44249 RepID=UPI00096EED6E|nr:sugar-binding transcriptional regulator [Paenibacillus odorifer]OME17073.1 Cro/Cl family transcriptional regulator [Paenibacillus odorifer]